MTSGQKSSMKNLKSQQRTKMSCCVESARKAPNCSPRTNRIASKTLLLPQPFRPTIMLTCQVESIETTLLKYNPPYSFSRGHPHTCSSNSITVSVL